MPTLSFTTNQSPNAWSLQQPSARRGSPCTLINIHNLSPYRNFSPEPLQILRDRCRFFVAPILVERVHQLWNDHRRRLRDFLRVLNFRPTAISI